MATSTISPSGGRVVRYCSHRPGVIMMRTMRFSLRPAKRMISYETPATTGRTARRLRIRSQRSGQPKKT